MTEGDNKLTKLHYFDRDIAIKVGVDEAVVFQHVKFWIEVNEANQRNFNDGCYWTYNSVTAFRDYLPYFTENQLRRCLKKLIESDFLISANYNHHGYDRTTWYALGSGYFDFLADAERNSDSAKIEMEDHEGKNAADGFQPPIPDRNKNRSRINHPGVANTSASGRTRINVSCFFDCSQSGPDEDFEPREEITSFCREEIDKLGVRVNDSYFIFWEFWDHKNNQPHGRKTKEEWLTHLKGWLAKDVKGGFGH